MLSSQIRIEITIDFLIKLDYLVQHHVIITGKKYTKQYDSTKRKSQRSTASAVRVSLFTVQRILQRF